MKINATLVKQLRTEKSWSQEQLGDACGLSLRTIQRLENTGKASADSVQALAVAFDIDPSRLMLSEVDKAVSPLMVIRESLLKFNDFSSTAKRSEYWWFFLFVMLILAITVVVHERVSQIILLFWSFLSSPLAQGG